MDKHQYYAACRAIARNPKAIVDLLSQEQIEALAELQSDHEAKKADYEIARRETNRAVSRAMSSLLAK